MVRKISDENHDARSGPYTYRRSSGYQSRTGEQRTDDWEPPRPEPRIAITRGPEEHNRFLLMCNHLGHGQFANKMYCKQCSAMVEVKKVG
jgi:hypothetical protein